MSRPGRPGARRRGVVFDAEALLAFFSGEEGAEAVHDLLQAVEAGEHPGFLNDVNAAEVWYVVKRRLGKKEADEHLAWLRSAVGLRPISSDDTWLHAAAIKADHPMSLADAFALATGKAKDCIVVTGSDAELAAAGEVGVQIERIRPVR